MASSPSAPPSSAGPSFLAPAPPAPLPHLLPRSVLDAPTPSALDGVSAALERAHRLFGCELAQELCVLLCMPQHCAATAQSLLQRFYFRRSLALFDAHCTAMACVFLAGKVEEHTRSMRDVLNVCYACKLRRQGRAPRPLQRGCELDKQWKANLIRTERFVLLSLGFQMYAVSNEHPHKASGRGAPPAPPPLRPAPPPPLTPPSRRPPPRAQFILYYVRALGGGDALAQSAWSYLNDSLRLDLCCRHAAEVIACASLLLAARDTRFALPTGVPWTQVFSSELAEVEAVAARIDALYADEAAAAERWPASLMIAPGSAAAASAPAPAPVPAAGAAAGAAR